MTQSTYDLAWESQGRPQVVYISFIKYVLPGEALPFRAPAPDAAGPDAAAATGSGPDAPGSGRRRTPSRSRAGDRGWRGRARGDSGSMIVAFIYPRSTSVICFPLCCRESDIQRNSEANKTFQTPGTRSG